MSWKKKLTDKELKYGDKIIFLGYKKDITNDVEFTLLSEGKYENLRYGENAPVNFKYTNKVYDCKFEYNGNTHTVVLYCNEFKKA